MVAVVVVAPAVIPPQTAVVAEAATPGVVERAQAPEAVGQRDLSVGAAGKPTVPIVALAIAVAGLYFGGGRSENSWTPSNYQHCLRSPSIDF